MEQKKRSFFERLTGSIRDDEPEKSQPQENGSKKGVTNWIEEENDEAELAVDVYQTESEIVLQTMVAGVKPDDLELTVARDMISIRGKREENRNVGEENYFAKELYWGKFSRSVSLPEEVEPEEVEATERHGLLTVKLKKVDKEKKNNVKVKSV